MKIVGITGSIGSGKSEVARVFSEGGAHVIDADRVAKTLLRKGKAGHRAVADAFGEGVLDDEGEIDRKKLAQIIFADPEKVEKINRLIHPLVHGWIKRRIAEIGKNDRKAIVVIDAPLLIEAGFDKMVDHLVLVTPGDTETAVARAAKRIGITLEEARRRLACQMPLSEKKKRADILIANDGTLEALRRKAKVILESLKKEEEKKA